MGITRTLTLGSLLALLLAAPATAAAAPANDAWRTAVKVGTGGLSATVDARTATAQADEPVPSCTGGAQVSNAVWYLVPKSSSSRLLRVGVRGRSAGAVVAAFAVQPHTGTELSCVASAAAGANAGFEHVLFGGANHYVLVGTKPGAASDVVDVQVAFTKTQWTSRAPLPARRQGVLAAGVGSDVYAFGGVQTSFVPGVDTGFHSTAVERLAPGAGLWKTVAQMPAGLSYGQAATLGSRIHMVGGLANPVHGAGCAVNAHYVFDPKRRTFSEAAPAPGPVTWDYAAAADPARGLLYVAGGIWDPTPCDVGAQVNDQQPTNRIRAWQASTNRWFELRPLVEPRQGPAAQVVGGKLIVAGGLRGNAAVATTEAYDPVSGLVTRMAPMPAPVYGAASGLGYAADGRPLLYVVGGWTSIGSTGDTGATQVLDVRANKWFLLSPRMTPRDAVAGAVAGGHLFSIGGHGPQPIRAVERLKVDNAPPALRPRRSGRTVLARASDPSGVVSIEWRMRSRVVARGARAPYASVAGGTVTARDAAGNARTVRVATR